MCRNPGWYHKSSAIKRGRRWGRPLLITSMLYRLTAEGVSQLGKKVLATIFDVCPLVALLNGRKYGLLLGGTHGSDGTEPH